MKILLIQTAFIGDVVLATPLIERLKEQFGDKSSIDFLLKKGNESLLDGHPYIRQVLIFDKKKGKYRHLWHLIRQIRSESYDCVINLHRFFSSGLICLLSGAKETRGFQKNPLSFAFTKSFQHIIGQTHDPQHEVNRNLSLLQGLASSAFCRPKLYPSEEDFQVVPAEQDYLCIAPASIWYTKQFPEDKWMKLIQRLASSYHIYLLGGPSDRALCERIQQSTHSRKVEVLAGELSFLQSAALMSGAQMNIVNDSAPLHFASAMNAPVTAIFCSTVPAFGFWPLSDQSVVVETQHQLSCRPCGLHGKTACPEGHFRCAEIETEHILATISREF
ncbi:MAG: glycosyltransferase family 9 protein [Bacteroidota bacterium]